MPTFDDCIAEAQGIIEEWGEQILKATIQTRHGIIEIRYIIGNGYKLVEIPE